MEIKFDNRTEYLCVKIRGEFKTDQAAKLFYEWVAGANLRANRGAVWDCRQVSGLESPPIPILDYFEGSKLIAEMLPLGFRLAILLTPQQYPAGRFSEDVMVNRGACVKATTSLKEALTWLGINPTALPARQLRSGATPPACEHW